MSALLPIICIIIYFVLAAKSARKKNARKAAAVFPAADVKPAAVPRSVFSEGESYADDEGCVGGSLTHEEHAGLSVSDDMGCVGGSLMHSEHEGGETVKRSTDWQESELRTSYRKAVTPADMRRAVILSEILRPPVALRGKENPNA